MTEATTTHYDWRRDDASGGLYVLYTNGVRTLTALVDRGAPRAEQLDQLKTVDWLPDYNLSRYFERIVSGKTPNTSFRPLQSDRLYDPFGTYKDYSTVVDTDEEASDHPLRRYLWPSLDSNGQLVLEPGETFLASTSLESMTLGSAERFTHSAKTSFGFIDYTKRVVLTLTTKRLVATGRIIPPPKVQQDYSGGSSTSGKSLALTLVSPTGGLFTPDLADMLAYRKGRQRKRALASQRPSLHVRLEWLAAAGVHVDTIQRSKALFTKRQPPRRELAAIVVHTHTAPLGDTGYARYWFFLDRDSRPQAEAFASQLAGAIQAIDGMSLRAPETVTTPVKAGRPGIGAVEGGEHRRDTWPVDGGVPFSLPAQVWS